MKRILILFISTVLFCVSSFAQNKIVFVNDYVFYDEKLGIKKLVDAVNSTYTDDFVTPRISKRIRELKVEIEKLKNSNKPIENEALEISNLEDDLKRRRETDEKRRSILVEPVLKKIEAKLEIFSTQKGYTKILDLSDDKVANAILYLDESIDITKDFIKFCNKEFEKEKVQKQ